jgi:V/A-type H+/Na+-transporting ATPase subunit F
MLGLVIGDSDMVTGFRLVGVEGIEVSSVEEAREALEKALARNDLAIVIISEEFSAQSPVREAIDSVRRERISPLIVEVPGSRGKPSEIRMSDLISKTLGLRV